MPQQSPKNTLLALSRYKIVLSSACCLVFFVAAFSIYVIPA